MARDNMEFVRVDKNGTEIWIDHTCPRCGGAGGADQWKFTGWTCYECGGTGLSVKGRVEKRYTPEYRAKLDEMAKKRLEKKKAKALAEAEVGRQKFLSEYENGMIYIAKGDTYSIKDELKAEGFIFNGNFGWHSRKATDRPCWQVPVEQFLYINDWGEYRFIDYVEIKAIVDALKDQENPEKASQFQGEVGQRITFQGKVVAVFSYETPSFNRYEYVTMYINKIMDADGNVYIWRTGNSLEGEGQITGTVKAHEEYKGIKQTILTRCKIK